MEDSCIGHHEHDKSLLPHLGDSHAPVAALVVERQGAIRHRVCFQEALTASPLSCFAEESEQDVDEPYRRCEWRTTPYRSGCRPCRGRSPQYRSAAACSTPSVASESDSTVLTCRSTFTASRRKRSTLSALSPTRASCLRTLMEYERSSALTLTNRGAAHRCSLTGSCCYVPVSHEVFSHSHHDSLARTPTIEKSVAYCSSCSFLDELRGSARSPPQTSRPCSLPPRALLGAKVRSITCDPSAL